FNFLEAIEQIKQFFDDPMDAIHCFYAFVGYWDITSTIAENEYHEGLQMVGYKGKKISESVLVPHKHRRNFKKFIENHFVFTNQGSGLTADYYFSRFDEVIVKLNPEYAKQHGIFFTDDKLSRFAHWFIEEKIIENVGENYIIVDPAAGSGNLIANYKGKLKHKIVSDYQPDLLRTIERRMRVDPYHRESGFTIIPKASENKGLNFLDKSATDYLAEIEKALHRKNLKLDQAFAFLLNPPYKNTDQHAKFRQNNEANYEIHEDILALTGQDAGKERYLAFLAQILLICKEQNSRNDEHLPLLMIFTPTSWLIPRPSFEKFREIFDTYFEYKAGFITTSNEFFKLEGRWAVAFTVWQFRKPTENAKNKILLHDFSALTRRDLFFDWDEKNPKDFKKLRQIFLKSKIIRLHNSRGDIRETLPFLKKKDKSVRQSRYNMYRNWSASEKNEKIVSGFPLKDDRHQNYNVPYGFAKANFVGFMEDNTPVRLAQDSHKRMSNQPDRVWFLLMTAFSSVNLSQIHSGAANSRSYCAYDLKSAQALFAWFGISKAVNGRYPVWANQYDLWKINFKKSKFKAYFYSLCYAYALAENRCVQTVFEKNNPVADAPEVFVDNPLCPINRESFWNTVLDSEISQEKIDLLSENEVIFSQNNLAWALVEAVKNLYRFWNSNYCQAQTLRNVGLENEPYFKYFAYADFVSPFSGLIQIKKYAEVNSATDLYPYFEKITNLSKLVKEEMYELLINEFGYFD
ncbi:MAG: hypothetical protein EAZ97_02895, partial [Bacteroidetes bacterium]